LEVREDFPLIIHQKNPCIIPTLYFSHYTYARFFLFLASILISLAWLSPDHAFPWLTFSSEMLSFAAVLSLLAGLCDQNLRVPKIQWVALPIVTIPLLQWMCGLVLDLSSALLFSFYLLAFWFVTIASYNLAIQNDRKKLLFVFAMFYLSPVLFPV
jgi:hypothetical protein